MQCCPKICYKKGKFKILNLLTKSEEFYVDYTMELAMKILVSYAPICSQLQVLLNFSLILGVRGIADKIDKLIHRGGFNLKKMR